MSGKPVPTRYPDDLLADIDALALRLGLNRSQLIRLVMRNATGNDAVRATLEEIVLGIKARIRERVARAEQAALETLRESLLEPDPEMRDSTPALPASGEDIVDGEVVMEGLRGRRRARK